MWSGLDWWWWLSMHGTLSNNPTGNSVTQVVLKAQGGAFGGWSWTCAPSDEHGNLITPTAITAPGPNYCVVKISADNPNVTVGAIFN